MLYSKTNRVDYQEQCVRSLFLVVNDIEFTTHVCTIFRTCALSHVKRPCIPCCTGTCNASPDCNNWRSRDSRGSVERSSGRIHPGLSSNKFML